VVREEASMAEKRTPSIETIAVQAGHSPDPATLSRGVPVYRTSSFTFKSAEHAANLFALKESGNIYSRIGNPTNEILEARVSLLEGGAASVAVASGTAAIFNTVITIAKVGDEIVSASNLYGGTYTMFDAILPDFGITTKFVGDLDPASFDAAVTDRTRLIYIETIGNPVLDLADIDAISAVARKHHLPSWSTALSLRLICSGPSSTARTS
jgi:O-acetylhomoserine (thiol)-lyase